MKNVTLALDDDLLKEGRKYARQNHTTLNGLIRKMLSESVTGRQEGWLAECFNTLDAIKPNSQGKKWKRGDLYRV
ncbi:MAG: hypothetical protein V1913_03645 [Fibrobacterota bacterium]